MSEERNRMPRSETQLVAMCVGTIAFAVAFVFPLFTPQSVLWYYVVERRWAYEVKPTGLAMDFYGRVFFAVIAWSLSVIVTILVARRLSTLNARVRSLLVAWAITATVFFMFYFAWMLLHRVPTPVPIPDWYTPR